MPVTRIPFWVHIVDPQPFGLEKAWDKNKGCGLRVSAANRTRATRFGVTIFLTHSQVDHPLGLNL